MRSGIVAQEGHPLFPRVFPEGLQGFKPRGERRPGVGRGGTQGVPDAPHLGEKLHFAVR